MTATAPPSSLKMIAARVDEQLAALLTTQRARWVAFDPDLAAPLSEIERLVFGGGKRLRPAFCYWGFVGFGGDPDDRAVFDAGSALELVHAFALFHDDIMDDAAHRRGQPTAHRVLADQHRRDGLPGESRRYGEGLTILVGDLTFVYADMALDGANGVAWNVWNELRLEVNIGQILDVVGSARGVRDVAQAERIATYKSAKYTIERPLHLGAALAVPDRFEDVAPGLSAYGVPLGVAFQMRDDVMGAFGDTAVTGKPVGDDLVEGKPTPLLARAVAAATPDQAAVLDRVGEPGLDRGDIAAIQDAIRSTGALDELEREIDRLTESAIAAASVLPIESDAKDALIDLATYLAHRQC